MRVEADAPSPALLVLNDANYPGWRARINGAGASIIAANYLFRGVLLPAGKSVIEFTYEPMSFRAGMVASGAAFVVLALLILYERRRKVIRWSVSRRCLQAAKRPTIY